MVHIHKRGQHGRRGDRWKGKTQECRAVGGGEEAEGREEALDGKRSKGHGGADVKNGVRSPSLRGSLRHVASSWHRVLVAPSFGGTTICAMCNRSLWDGSS